MDNENNGVVESALSTIRAMRLQEETRYRMTGAENLYQQQESVRPTRTTTSTRMRGPLNSQLVVDTDCRSKIAAWAYEIVDYCKLHRETVEICMSYLDRLLVAEEAQEAEAEAACASSFVNDRRLFTLAAITSLYTAVKIHEPEVMDAQFTSRLSRGAYSVEQIEEMEQRLLFALGWHMNPPTALAFARQFLCLIPRTVLDDKMRNAIYSMTTYQTELAVGECAFVSIKASTVAFCALMNSLETLNCNKDVLGFVAYVLTQALGLDCSDASIADIQNLLYLSVAKHSTGNNIIAHTTRTPLNKRQPCNTGSSRSNQSFDTSPRSSTYSV